MKNFVAPDMRTALKMVREELGADAVILANRRVSGGIELLATAEPVAPPPPRPQRPAAVSAPAAAQATAAAAAPIASHIAAGLAFPDPQQADSRADEAGWWQMQQELRSMRDLIEQQLSGMAWQQHRASQPAAAAMWRRLQRLGLAPAIVHQLLEHYDPSTGARAGWQRLMARLTALLPAVASDPVAQGGTFALVGPTGAGKTTTIAKLAARYVLANGHEQLGLMTLDSYRIGAHEQLRTLGRVLNVPLKVAAPNDLASALYDLRHCRLVLIDTAGLNTHSPELRSQLAALDALGDRVQCLQVMSASTQHQVVRAAHRAYRTANTAGCVLTKLDEAGSLGEIISLLIDSQLPLLYSSGGQSIPDDIAVGTGKTLVARAIELARDAECDEQRLAEAFAGHARAGLPGANAKAMTA